MKDPKALSEMIAEIEPGKKVTISVLRDGNEQTVDVTLGNLSDYDKSQQASADQQPSAERHAARFARQRSG